MFDALHKRIAELKGLASRIAVKSAPALKPVVTESARTKRGNVPLYIGPLSDIALPITIVASADSVTIRAVDWCMRGMVNKGAPAEWMTVVSTVARGILGGDK